jgi:hypothetical protein
MICTPCTQGCWKSQIMRLGKSTEQIPFPYPHATCKQPQPTGPFLTYKLDGPKPLEPPYQLLPLNWITIELNNHWTECNILFSSMTITYYLFKRIHGFSHWYFLKYWNFERLVSFEQCELLWGEYYYIVDRRLQGSSLTRQCNKDVYYYQWGDFPPPPPIW